MNDRFSEELFLTNETGKMLYHKYAEHMPIIDYHCHLQPVEIAENKEFEDLGEMWLRGDHYKWRCMRTFGIDEKYITGDASYYEKYMKFAEILPQLVGNVKSVGQSTGFDCCDDAAPVKGVGELLNNLTTIGELPKTIIYPLDGTKIETWAILAAGFCDNGTKAKVQLGAPWWFNDQAFGIQRQFEACANLYPVSLSVGMLTDSRSFISYPRHELYRRVLCSYLGSLVERGEYFSGEEELKKTIENVCFNNVNEFFGFNVKV